VVFDEIKKEIDLGMRNSFFLKISITLGEPSTEYYEVNLNFDCNCQIKLNNIVVEERIT
jgi:hypothetical protein